MQGLRAPVAQCAQALHIERHRRIGRRRRAGHGHHAVARFGRFGHFGRFDDPHRLLPHVRLLRAAHHGLRKLLGVGGLYGHVVHAHAPPQHGHVIRIGHHLAELVRDEDHTAVPLVRELAHMAQHLIGLLRGQHRGGFVKDEQAGAQIELLE